MDQKMYLENHCMGKCSPQVKIHTTYDFLVADTAQRHSVRGEGDI